MSDFDKEDKELFERAIEKWGLEAQVDMAIEECAELIVAARHYERGKIGLDEFIEEMADVRIMYEQLCYYFGEEEAEKRIDEKMDRLKERLDE